MESGQNPLFSSGRLLAFALTSAVTVAMAVSINNCRRENERALVLEWSESQLKADLLSCTNKIEALKRPPDDKIAAAERLLFEAEHEAWAEYDAKMRPVLEAVGKRTSTEEKGVMKAYVNTDLNMTIYDLRAEEVAAIREAETRLVKTYARLLQFDHGWCMGGRREFGEDCYGSSGSRENRRFYPVIFRLPNPPTK